LPAFLPGGCGLHVEALVSQAPNVSGLTVQLSATRHCATCPMCPLCGRRSHRVQSAYGRTLHDLPWCGAALTWRLRVRRFVCGTPQCPRRIFAEQFPALASLVGARLSARLPDSAATGWLSTRRSSQTRLAAHLGMGASSKTILGLMRASPLPCDP